MSITNNVPLNWYSAFNEKIEKDLDDFWHRNIDFESQILALFDTSPLHQFLKFNNFLWVCWFLGKNLTNFVPSAWKLDNPYYHSRDYDELTYRNWQSIWLHLGCSCCHLDHEVERLTPVTYDWTSLLFFFSWSFLSYCYSSCCSLLIFSFGVTH